MKIFFALEAVAFYELLGMLENVMIKGHFKSEFRLDMCNACVSNVLVFL